MGKKRLKLFSLQLQQQIKQEGNRHKQRKENRRTILIRTVNTSKKQRQHANQTAIKMGKVHQTENHQAIQGSRTTAALIEKS